MSVYGRSSSFISFNVHSRGRSGRTVFAASAWALSIGCLAGCAPPSMGTVCIQDAVAVDAAPNFTDPPAMKPEPVTETLEQRAESGDIEALAMIVEPLLLKDADLSTVSNGFHWLTKAAEAGMAEAQHRLGCRLYFGDGVTQDQVAGVSWLRRAAEQECAEACGLVGMCLIWGAGVEVDHAAGVAFLRKALALNEHFAALGLAACYENGLGLEKNEAEAFKLFRQAAQNGVPAAQGELGRCYATGMGTEKNPAEAFRWTKTAAEAEHEASRFVLAGFYRHGFGTVRDVKEAARWYRGLAEDGDTESQIEYAGLLLSGQGVEQDIVEAGRWIKRAAGRGHARAQRVMGALYADGKGVPRNLVLAYAWTSLAAAQGVDDAAKMLDKLESIMTREQVAEAQGLATTFRPTSPDSGNTGSDSAASTRGGRRATGSGFFVTHDGHFVTNHHVIENAKRIVVKTHAGVFPATIVRVDSVNDLAVLKVSGTFAALPVHGSGGLKLADRVATVGYPNPELQGVAAKYSSGEVASLTGACDDPRYIQISVPIQPGNSGGPLMDAAGRVIGVVAARLDKAYAADEISDLPENVNYAVKGSILLNVLESIAEVGPGLMPVPVQPVTSAADAAKIATAASGLVIVEL